MTYLRYLLGSTVSLLAVAAVLNFSIDPAGMYRTGNGNPDSYAVALLQSRNGLWWPENSYEERAIKKALIRRASPTDCIVIGSSHVMQVSSQPAIRSLSDVCGTILNLAVSGASIEDHITLVYMTLLNWRPAKIVLSIDPWTFAFGKDQRWLYYAVDYQQAKAAVLNKADFKSVEVEDTFRVKTKNLFSLEYTSRSVRKALGELRSNSNSYAAEAAPELVESLGGEHPVLLPDGSMLYSAKYLAAATSQDIPIGGVTYKTDGELNQARAISAYRSFLWWIKSLNVEPVLLLSPYHENVWKSANSPTVLALQATEIVARTFAQELDLELVGTYNAHSAGCLDTEFYDFMHPKITCLAKLRGRKLSKVSRLNFSMATIGLIKGDRSVTLYVGSVSNPPNKLVGIHRVRESACGYHKDMARWALQKPVRGVCETL